MPLMLRFTIAYVYAALPRHACCYATPFSRVSLSADTRIITLMIGKLRARCCRGLLREERRCLRYARDELTCYERT